MNLKTYKTSLGVIFLTDNVKHAPFGIIHPISRVTIALKCMVIHMWYLTLSYLVCILLDFMLNFAVKEV